MHEGESIMKKKKTLLYISLLLNCTLFALFAHQWKMNDEFLKYSFGSTTKIVSLIFSDMKQDIHNGNKHNLQTKRPNSLLNSCGNALNRINLVNNHFSGETKSQLSDVSYYLSELLDEKKENFSDRQKEHLEKMIDIGISLGEPTSFEDYIYKKPMHLRIYPKPQILQKYEELQEVTEQHQNVENIF
jgi:hypothetical protein